MLTQKYLLITYLFLRNKLFHTICYFISNAYHAISLLGGNTRNNRWPIVKSFELNSLNNPGSNKKWQRICCPQKDPQQYQWRERKENKIASNKNLIS